MDYTNSIFILISFIVILFSLGVIITMIIFQTNSAKDLSEFDLHEEELNELLEKRN